MSCNPGCSGYNEARETEASAMPKVRITVTESRCRCGYCSVGDEFIVEDLCPPVCHELWHAIYPYVFALLNGADLDHGETRARVFTGQCPDGGRVKVRGEIVEE